MGDFQRIDNSLPHVDSASKFNQQQKYTPSLKEDHPFIKLSSKIIQIILKALLVPIEFVDKYALRQHAVSRKAVTLSQKSNVILGKENTKTPRLQDPLKVPSLPRKKEDCSLSLSFINQTLQISQVHGSSVSASQAQTEFLYDPQDLKDFLEMFEPLVNESDLKQLIVDVKALQVAAIQGDKLKSFQTRLLSIFTLETLRQRGDYQDLLRAFAIKHPDTRLFPKIGFKGSSESQTPVFANALLAAIASPILASKTLQVMKEGRIGIFASPLFDGWDLSHLASFITRGNFIGWEINSTNQFHIYMAAHALCMEQMLRAARYKIIFEIEKTDFENIDSLNALWDISETYLDPGLRYACIKYVLNLPSNEQNSDQIPERLKALCQKYKTLRLSLDADVNRNHGCLDGHFRNANLNTLNLCHELGIESINLSNLNVQEFETLSKCSHIKRANLQLIVLKSNERKQYFEGVITLLKTNKNLQDLKIANLKVPSPQSEALTAIKALSTALQEATSLRSFEWSSTELSSSEMAILIDGICSNSSITQLELRAQLDDNSLKEIEKAVLKNHTLRKLCLETNNFSEAAKKSFEQAIATRTPKLSVAWRFWNDPLVKA